MKVLFAPTYESNPYQSNLAAGLDESGIDVRPLQPTPLFGVVRGLLRHPDADVVHVHWLHEFYYSRYLPLMVLRAVMLLPQLLLLRFTSANVVWTVHNLSAHEVDPRIEAPMKRLFARVVCDRFIVHCDHATQLLVDQYGLPPSIRDRTDVIPHGHYIDDYPDRPDRTVARERLSLATDATVFLFFGSIRPYKNVERLVETFDRVCGPDSRLLVVGSPQTAALEREVVTAAATANRVTTRLEFVPDDEVQLYLSAADVVVLPFEDILTSGSAVLAMSYGRPFVAPAIGCLPELAGEDGALLYPDDEPDGLAEALQTAETADLDEMGRRGLERIRHHDWTPIAERTAEAYAACE